MMLLLSAERCRGPAEASTYDARALQVAQAVHGHLQPHLTLLFGSRARGDCRPDSDIDLLIVTEKPLSHAEYAEACRTGFRAIEAIYANDRSGLDVVCLDRASYLRDRDGQNHVAGQATRDGVTVDGLRLHQEPVPEGGTGKT